MTDESSHPDLLGPLMDEFVERFRRGEKPSLTEFVRRQPELEADIRELFPTLVMIEHADADMEHSGGKPAHRMTADGRELTQLGDYRILREIGRGGMGVVYEAVQESLGRHVALKVLPWNALLNSTHLERFQREARVAAALHHTNIVPVFGVGEHDGVHFYAMQHISGQSLDNVLNELRSLRAGSLARGPVANEASSAVLGGLSDSSSASGQHHYFRRVAQIGAEIADALAYAHGRGVLHRDIKPSNLMIDSDGTVWVTDFGLARTTLSPSDQTDADRVAKDISRTGDLIGTLKYMAPERFRGQADVRSDLYSLGLTLYEMLTLRTAFDATDRVELIRQVTHETPPAPRRVDAHIPRDLETIVLKSIAREPALRYRSAADMSEDLRRFLEDRPIVARRTPLRERAVLWCRRNRAVASLVGLVASLLVLLAVGSMIAAFRLNERNVTALKNLERATAAEGKERAARELADRRLFDAYLAQARAGRWSGRAGRRFDSLDAVTKAAAMLPTLALDESAVRELRDEAIGSLALVDVRLANHWPDDTRPGAPFRFTAFDRQVERCARLDDKGEIVVRRLVDNSVSFRFSDKWSDMYVTPYMQFSPNDEYFAASGQAADESVRMKVWKLSDRSVTLDVPLEIWTSGHQLAFARNSQRLAVHESATHVAIFDVISGQLVTRLPLSMSTSLTLSPTGDRLAAITGSNGNEVSIVSVVSGKTEHQLPHPLGVMHLAYSPDGRLIATACNDKNVYVWDTSQLDQPWAVCRGHLSQATLVAFSSDGHLLMSTSYDGTTRIWNPRHGEQLVSIDHRSARFSDDNRWLAFNDPAAAYGRCELSDGAECRVLSTSPPADSVVEVAFSPDGNLLATASRRSGIDVWDATNCKEVARFQGELGSSSVAFTADGMSLITSTGSASIDRWPVEVLRSGQVNELLPRRERLAQAHSFPSQSAVSRDGRSMVASLAPDVINVYRLGASEPPVQMKSVPSFSWFVAISPNGRWIAASEKRNGDIPVWDAESGELLAHLKTTDSQGALVSFSPDNRWLIVSEFGRFVFYETNTWHEARRLPCRGSACYGRLAFSPDMQLCAALEQRDIILYDATNFRDLATLSTSRARQLSTGYPEGTGGLSFSPDGHQLAAGTMQGTVQLWDLRRLRRTLADLGLNWSSLPNQNSTRQVLSNQP